MSLDKLREVSVSIITSSITHPLGLVKLPSSNETPFNPKERHLLDLQRELDALSRQIVETRESTGIPDKRTIPLPAQLTLGRRLLGEAGISESSLLDRLETAQADYFKARQDNANKDIISQSLLRVNPTLKAVHAPKNSLNSTERNLYIPLARRDVLASQLIKLSHEYSQLQEELSSLEVEVLSMQSLGNADVDTMRENKEIYADVEKLSLEYERTRLSSLSPAERDQLAQLEAEIAEERSLREIVRNVLQGLILDSGLNWASDPELLNAMLLCGEEVQ